MVNTKIIYISGGENLDRAAIKTAFDEVRQTLGLGADTLLFGVPLEDEETATESVVAEKPKKTRKSRVEKLEINEEVITETTNVSDAQTVSEPVIPILSVLSGGKTESEPVQELQQQDMSEPPEIIETQQVSILEITESLEEELPTSENKIPQTIEDIFENLKPLPEEKIIETPRSETNDSRSPDLDDDATLSKLAAEFVESEENKKPEPETRTKKMGKLKNILPFKKAKKDDAGMLGDLFGWAGIAANEDDAGTSGFFAAR